MTSWKRFKEYWWLWAAAAALLALTVFGVETGRSVGGIVLALVADTLIFTIAIVLTFRGFDENRGSESKKEDDP